MQDTKIYRQRISRLIDRIYALRYSHLVNLKVSYCYDPDNQIPYNELSKMRFKLIKPGKVWGQDWGSAWFHLEGMIPKENQQKDIGILFDIEGEACVFKNGYPFQGLTGKIDWMQHSTKKLIDIPKTEKQQKIDLWIEGAANSLFGARKKDYCLKQAEAVEIHPEINEIYYDLVTLNSLLECLDEDSPRWKRILHGLNEIANHWNSGDGLQQCLQISKILLSVPADHSALTAFSIGHAHLDLAWLWPVRETRRKGGRTFSTALRLMEKYPDYKFGASQPQLYQWIKTDYPQLFDEIKKAVAEKKWECQGAMWVEADTNIPSGESLVRQCIHGIKFFQDEFDVKINHLWLPDVFGYSAALPQILRLCGIDFFMTQKISWNETNTFPHHTFYWQGIDGTRILTHFLPTNDYNLANLPEQLAASEKRFTQSDVASAFLNLYGIGDGGGGPSEAHIEMGLRQQNIAGAPNFKFSFAADFFLEIAQLDPGILPGWQGELYLELHRGTYTTQALMKKFNRLLETRLHDLEFLSALATEITRIDLDNIWQDTLLHQFHDILPGSSIKQVYEDAHHISRENLKKIDNLQQKLLGVLWGNSGSEIRNFVVINTQSWARTEVVNLEMPDGIYQDEMDKIFKSTDGRLNYQVEVPAYGYNCISFKKVEEAIPEDTFLKAEEYLLENEMIRVEFDDTGSIVKMYDKEYKREYLKSKANQLLLWEDIPNNWGAWDINHFYRETKPETAIRTSVTVSEPDQFTVSLNQILKIGNSEIRQTISLTRSSRLIRIENKVNWQEEHKMLRVKGEFDLLTPYSTAEIQFGLLKRPTHSNTSWDRAKFEVCAHRFADLSQPDYGVALINDCKYGHYLKDNIIELNLLRSPKDVDPTADLDQEHEFTYAYYPHNDVLEKSDVLQQAHNLNDPLLIHSVEKFPEKKETSYYRLSSGTVKIDTVKPAINGEGIILRIYETMGSKAEVLLTAEYPWKKFSETDPLENSITSLQSSDRTCILKFNPFQIRTFRIER